MIKQIDGTALYHQAIATIERLRAENTALRQACLAALEVIEPNDHDKNSRTNVVIRQLRAVSKTK